MSLIQIGILGDASMHPPRSIESYACNRFKKFLFKNLIKSERKVPFVKLKIASPIVLLSAL